MRNTLLNTATSVKVTPFMAHLELSDLRKREDALNVEMGNLKNQKDWISQLGCVFHDIEKSRGLQKPSGSKSHALADAASKNKLMTYASERSDIGKTFKQIYGENISISKAVSFVIEHDWAAVISDAVDSDGDFVLPYEHNMFELRVAGHHICMYVHDKTELLFVQDGDWWHVLGAHEDFGKELAEFMHRQIRAVCISLDAEVAVTEVIRQPERLNITRAKAGKYPLQDYRVVRLNRTKCAARDQTDPTGKRHRLHFVRGHWRRYADHKTWIKWHLRGDIDLGFIDKHYRL